MNGNLSESGFDLRQVREEANGVYSVRLYDRDFCQQAVKGLASHGGWAEAQVLSDMGDGTARIITQPEVRTARLLTFAHELEIYNDFKAKMGSLVLQLIRQLWHVEFTEHTEVQAVCYGPGGHYKAHVDGGFFLEERYFTVLCYVNDTFEGGGTSFPSLGFTTTPRCGEAILFPARYVHCAEPVIAGEKFVLVSWVLGPAPVKWI